MVFNYELLGVKKLIWVLRLSYYIHSAPTIMFKRRYALGALLTGAVIIVKNLSGALLTGALLSVHGVYSRRQI